MSSRKNSILKWFARFKEKFATYAKEEYIEGNKCDLIGQGTSKNAYLVDNKNGEDIISLKKKRDSDSIPLNAQCIEQAKIILSHDPKKGNQTSSIDYLLSMTYHDENNIYMQKGDHCLANWCTQPIKTNGKMINFNEKSDRKWFFEQSLLLLLELRYFCLRCFQENVHYSDIKLENMALMKDNVSQYYSIGLFDTHTICLNTKGGMYPTQKTLAFSASCIPSNLRVRYHFSHYFLAYYDLVGVAVNSVLGNVLYTLHHQSFDMKQNIDNVQCYLHDMMTKLEKVTTEIIEKFELFLQFCSDNDEKKYRKIHVEVIGQLKRCEVALQNYSQHLEQKDFKAQQTDIAGMITIDKRFKENLIGGELNRAYEHCQDIQKEICEHYKQTPNLYLTTSITTALQKIIAISPKNDEDKKQGNHAIVQFLMNLINKIDQDYKKFNRNPHNIDRQIKRFFKEIEKLKIINKKLLNVRAVNTQFLSNLKRKHQNGAIVPPANFISQLATNEYDSDLFVAYDQLYNKLEYFLNRLKQENRFYFSDHWDDDKDQNEYPQDDSHPITLNENSSGRNHDCTMVLMMAVSIMVKLMEVKILLKSNQKELHEPLKKQMLKEINDSLFKIEKRFLQALFDQCSILLTDNHVLTAIETLKTSQTMIELADYHQQLYRVVKQFIQNNLLQRKKAKKIKSKKKIDENSVNMNMVNKTLDVKPLDNANKFPHLRVGIKLSKLGISMFGKRHHHDICNGSLNNFLDVLSANINKSELDQPSFHS